MGCAIEDSTRRWGNLNGSVVESAAVHAERLRRLCMVSIVTRKQLCIADAGAAAGRHLPCQAGELCRHVVCVCVLYRGVRESEQSGEDIELAVKNVKF